MSKHDREFAHAVALHDCRRRGEEIYVALQRDKILVVDLDYRVFPVRFRVGSTETLELPPGLQHYAIWDHALVQAAAAPNDIAILRVFEPQGCWARVTMTTPSRWLLVSSP